MALTHIQIWLMGTSMSLTTPHMGNWGVATCEAARPQSADALKQDHKIRIKTDLRALVPHRGYNHSKCVVHTCIIVAPLSLPFFFQVLSYCLYLPGVLLRSGIQWRQTCQSEEMAGWQRCRTSWPSGRHWLYRQRESLQWTWKLPHT